MKNFVLILILSPVFLKCSSQEAGHSRKSFLAIVRTTDSLHLTIGSHINDSICPYNTTDSVTITKHLSTPLGWTSDYECLFTSSAIDQLDSVMRAFEKETTIELSVVTFDSSWLSNKTLDDFVVGLQNTWGVGKRESNNGILIGFSANLRRIRISNGYGLESQLSDLETKKIIDDIIIPEFKTSRYFEGTMKGLLAIINKLR